MGASNRCNNEIEYVYVCVKISMMRKSSFDKGIWNDGKESFVALLFGLLLNLLVYFLRMALSIQRFVQVHYFGELKDRHQDIYLVRCMCPMI